MKIFYVQIDSRFKRPLKVVNKHQLHGKWKAVTGFMQEVGCTASSEKAMRLMVANKMFSVKDQQDCEITFEYIGVIKPEAVAQEIFADKDIASAVTQDPNSKGIWYSSGRGYYT